MVASTRLDTHNDTGTIRPVGVISALYITQALGAGFLTVGLVSILRENGTSLQTLGALQLIGLAWALKFLWAPVVDRFGSKRIGHYRSWVIPMQVGLIVSLLALAGLDDLNANLGSIVSLAIVYVLFSTTQDIAVDAIAVRLIGDVDRGPVNGIQVASTYIGNVLGGGVTVVVYDQFGWVPAIALLAALTSLGLVAVVLFSEPEPPQAEAQPVPFKKLLAVLGQPGCADWALKVVPLLYVGSGIVGGLLNPALIDAGWSLTRVGLVTSIYAAIPSIAAGLGAGWLIRTRGRAWVLGVGGMLLLFAILSLVPALVGTAPFVMTTAAVSLFFAAYTVMNVVAYTVMMDYSRPTSAGSDFTLMSCLGLSASFISAAVALALAAWVGYLPVALLGGVLVALATVRGISHLRRMDQPAASAS